MDILRKREDLRSIDPQTRAEKIFYVHATAYTLVNAGLIYLNYRDEPEKLWFQWPLAGWGIGLACHAADVFFTGRAAERVERRLEHRQERRERMHARREERRENVEERHLHRD